LAQLLHAAHPALEYFPAEHEMQPVLPLPLLYWPLGQLLQLPEEVAMPYAL
jgi:hypothetical protein